MGTESTGIIGSSGITGSSGIIRIVLIYLEINKRKRTWLMIGICKPPKQKDSLFLENLSNYLSNLKDCNNILLSGGFNDSRKHESATFYRFFQSREVKRFYKLTAVSLKSQVLKALAKRKFYRNCKNFDEDNFNKDLKLKLDSLKELDYSLFENTFIDA